MSGEARSLASFSLALKQIALRPFAGAAYRFIGTRFIDSPLATAGSMQRGGRFNPAASFEALYAALSAEAAMAEREGLLLTAPGIRLATQVGTGVLLRLECRLTAVLDLTDDKARERLATSLAMLLGPWLPWNARDPGEEPVNEAVLAPTQRIGLAAYKSNRIEALLAPSAKDPNGTCLILLPQRLQGGSSVKVDDPRGRVRAALVAAGLLKCG